MSSKLLSLPVLQKLEVHLDTKEVVVPASGAELVLNTAHEDITVRLIHPRSCVRLVLHQLLSGTNESRLRITVSHEANHTQAETIVKSVLLERSNSHVSGLLRVQEGTIGAASFFNHHCLAFGESSVTSIPSLEILNNDVTCSHAATIRTISETDLFPLTSRGIIPSEARQVIIDAFLNS